MKRFLAVIPVLIFAFAGTAEANATVTVSSFSPYQGDTVLVMLRNSAHPVSGSFLGRSLSFFTYHNASSTVLPVPALQKAGKYPLIIRLSNGETYKRTVTVRTKKFVKVVLGIPKELGITTGGLLTKLGEQKASIDDVVKHVTPSVYFNKSFGLPLYDNSKISTTFGSIRQTGNSLIHHWGIDLAGKEGSAVGAMSGGIVKSTYTDSVYGNVVIVDHGEGIYSLYLHLQKILVKEGEKIERGHVVGLLGHTGYATGPHLHLSMKIDSIPVDPVQFVELFKKY